MLPPTIIARVWSSPLVCAHSVCNCSLLVLLVDTCITVPFTLICGLKKKQSFLWTHMEAINILWSLQLISYHRVHNPECSLFDQLRFAIYKPVNEIHCCTQSSASATQSISGHKLNYLEDILLIFWGIGWIFLVILVCYSRFINLTQMRQKLS